jgi:hypothetical protein
VKFLEVTNRRLRGVVFGKVRGNVRLLDLQGIGIRIVLAIEAR